MGRRLTLEIPEHAAFSCCVNTERALVQQKRHFLEKKRQHFEKKVRRIYLQPRAQVKKEVLPKQILLTHEGHIEVSLFLHPDSVLG